MGDNFLQENVGTVKKNITIYTFKKCNHKSIQKQPVVNSLLTMHSVFRIFTQKTP